MPQPECQSLSPSVKEGRQSVPDLASEELESVWSITLEDLRHEWVMGSMRFAIAFNGLSCDVHEDCDRTCSDEPHYQGVCLIEDSVNDLVSRFVHTKPPHPSRATAQEVPRDFHWVKQQKVPKFEYSAINSLAGEIRLLRLKKGLFRSDIVECDLVTIPLDGDQEFQALSYRWSSATTDDVMLCNGKELDISPSLNAALKTFRESRELQDQLLWCDAVSIHQANLTEVSEQIPLMRRIYTEATGVFVHLGPAERQISRGLDLMHRLASVRQHLLHPEKYGAISIEDVTRLMPLMDDPCWTEYFTLYLSPWFSRTWILQEIALAKKANLGIGRYIVNWEVFEGSFHLLNEHNILTSFFQVKSKLEEVEPNLRNGLWVKILNFKRLQEIKHIARSPDNSSLMKVLRATRNFDVTQRRDKVVGVLGMIGDLPTELRALSDRSLNTAEVYHRTARYLLKTPSLPDVFAHAGLQRRIGLSKMPSWVPDWYEEKGELNQRPLTIFRPTPFLAGRGPEFCVTRALDDTMYPREVLSQGFCHHMVIRTGNACDHEKPGFAEAWFDSARTCLGDSDALLYENIEEAFARTLLVDDLYTGANAVASSTAIEDVVATFRAATARLRTSETGNVNQVSSELRECPTDAQVQTFQIQMMSAMQGRRFAITDTGYMCLAPSCTEIGDAVAILSGFPTPFIIRLETGSEISASGLERVRAQLVGDTYVHGLMHAESFIEAAKTGRPPYEIVLM